MVSWALRACGCCNASGAVDLPALPAAAAAANSSYHGALLSLVAGLLLAKT